MASAEPVLRVTLVGGVYSNTPEHHFRALTGEYRAKGQFKGKTWYQQSGGGAKLHYEPYRSAHSGREWHWWFAPAGGSLGGNQVVTFAAETPGGGVPRDGWLDIQHFPIPLRVTPGASAACDPTPPPAAQAAATKPKSQAAKAPASAPKPPKPFPAAPDPKPPAAACDPTPPLAASAEPVLRVTLVGGVYSNTPEHHFRALTGEYRAKGQFKGKTWYQQSGGGAKLYYEPYRSAHSGREWHWWFAPAGGSLGGNQVVTFVAETPGGGVPRDGWLDIQHFPIPLRVTPGASAACDPTPPPAAQAAATKPKSQAAKAPASAPKPPEPFPAAPDPEPPAANTPASAPKPFPPTQGPAVPAAQAAASEPKPPAAQAPAAAPQPLPAAPDDAAAAKQRDFSGNDDVSDVTFKPLAKFVSDFKPSKGADAYLKEDTLQVESISTTTGPFMDDIQAAWQITRDRVRNTSVLRQHEGLTEDHIFAIVAFTLEVQSFCLSATEDAEFYRQYNIALRKRAPKVMRSLAGYSHFLLGGLACMPGFQGTLWRGIRDEEAVKLAIDNYQPLAREIFWSACSHWFSSASPDRSVARNFATSKGLIFCLTVRECARDIKIVSAIPNEEERLILPNTKLIVMKTAFRASDGVWEIHLAESPGSFVF